jgi:extradiol dioxygenase family protein
MVEIRDAFSGFSVDDIEAAREFYGAKLGLHCQTEGRILKDRRLSRLLK